MRMRGASLWPFASWCLSGLQRPAAAVNPRIGLFGKAIITHFKLFVRLQCADFIINRQKLPDRHGQRGVSTG